jgi:hypothetical protein
MGCPPGCPPGMSSGVSSRENTLPEIFTRLSSRVSSEVSSRDVLRGVFQGFIYIKNFIHAYKKVRSFHLFCMTKVGIFFNFRAYLIQPALVVPYSKEIKVVSTQPPESG